MVDRVVDDQDWPERPGLDDGDAFDDPPRGRVRRFLGGLEEYLLAERERWGLWTPVFLGGGIAFYFTLPGEPAWWVGLLALALTLGLMVALRRHGWVVLVGLAVLAAATGFAAAQWRTAVVTAPMLDRGLRYAEVTGRVIEVEALARGARLLLAEITIGRLPPEATPHRARVRLAGRQTVPPVGAMVRLPAALHPPPEPAEPGAFDFQRHAFFEGIGAVGYVPGRIQMVTGPEPSAWRRLLIAFEQLRQDIARRVAGVVEGAAAPVTAALLNGEQSGIPEPVMEAFCGSGLAHLLSISGLHIGLVAGLVFTAVRSALALVEPVALRFPIKKWAALTGLLAAGAYTLLVGAPVPTLRSLLMTGLVLIAVMADRNPLSMRLVAFAAGVVLLTQPESLLGPSFQMSFGAVVALIAGFEAVSQRWRAWRTQAGWLGRLGLYLAGIALSSLLATLATTPFSVFHFQQIAFYGLLANMVAVPITSFWIMPCGLIAYLAMPFGLDKGPLVVMGWGVDAIVRIAEATAALPGAVLPLPAMPDWGLGLAVMGGLWLMLWSGRWRLFGLVGVVVGMASPMTAERPDILISGNGKLIAARGADGDLMLSSRQSARFQGEAWRRRDGRDPKTPASAWPAVGRSGDGRLACDALGCLYRAQGYTVALAHDAQALAEDCVASDLVIATVNARRCKAPRVVDRWRLRKEGATAVYLDRDGIRIETVRQARGERPWIKKGD